MYFFITINKKDNKNFNNINIFSNFFYKKTYIYIYKL